MDSTFKGQPSEFRRYQYNHDGGRVVKNEEYSSCLEKGKIFKEITTVVNQLKDRKKAAHKEDVCNYLCKERSFCYLKLFLTTK